MISQFILRSIVIFVVGLLLFYIGIIKWAQSKKAPRPVITRANGGWAATSKRK